MTILQMLLPDQLHLKLLNILSSPPPIFPKPKQKSCWSVLDRLDFKLVTLKSPLHVPSAINEIIKRESAKSLLQADLTLIPVPYISNHQVFRAQSQLQPQEFSEISVAGNFFIHPILSDIPVESINSDLHYTPPEIVVAPSPSAQCNSGKYNEIIRSSINKSRKTKVPCPECGKRTIKKLSSMNSPNLFRNKRHWPTTHLIRLFWMERNFIRFCELIGLKKKQQLKNKLDLYQENSVLIF